MTQFLLHGRLRPSLPNDSQQPAPLRAAEPSPWEASPAQDRDAPTEDESLHSARGVFGDRLVDAALALDLLAPPKGPLPAGTELHALDALREASQALSGVDFLTQLEFSAVHQGAGFKKTARRLGLSAHALTPNVCQRVDGRMAQRFAEASASGAIPVDRQAAAQWLQDELFILTC